MWEGGMGMREVKKIKTKGGEERDEKRRRKEGGIREEKE